MQKLHLGSWRKWVENGLGDLWLECSKYLRWKRRGKCVRKTMAKRGGEEISLFEWEHQKCEEHNLETYPRGCRDLLLVMPGRESSLTRGYRGIFILTIRCQSTVWQSFLIMSLLSFSVLSSPPIYLSLSLSPSFTLFPSYFPSSFSPVLSQLSPPPSLALPPSTVLPFPHASLPLLTSFEVFLATKNVLVHQGFPVIFVRELKKQVSQLLAFSFLGWLEAAY